jgi:hypothetical protein
MSVIYSENSSHRSTIATAEMVRQVAVADASAAAIKVAEIQFQRTCLKSARTNGVSPHQFIIALQELGTGGA